MSATSVLVLALVSLASLGISVAAWADAAVAQPGATSPGMSLRAATVAVAGGQQPAASGGERAIAGRKAPATGYRFLIAASVPLTTPTPPITPSRTPTPSA